MKGKTGHMSLKLDMSKAYDRIEQNFLEVVMKGMSFASKGIDLIMKCVFTISYWLLLNGVPQKAFKPSKGIRQGDRGQGDLLSFYLFILYLEALGTLLIRVEETGIINDIPMVRGQLYINHLFIVDDS